MHQVYDDEMTFKLVAAASNVSGLPVEVCLEEFGKHFLVYCQKNGYDQILRVLGSNLYDFLTNLDNLHDHLASIYPGMRAPSFRVTRHLNTNQQQQPKTTTPTFHGSDNTPAQCEQMSHVSMVPTSAVDLRGDELHKQNASCSMAGSMYLHYYSERAGLSPIVKGLVMAVAREFFQTDIQVTECDLGKLAKAEAETATTDDHVVLKIDKRSSPTASERKSASEEPVSESRPTLEQQDEMLKMDPVDRPKSPSFSSLDCPQQPQQATQTIQESAPTANAVVNIYDSLSTNARDSLVNSEIMMQTFPFHVIFDRQFNLVQVGKSLLRVTSSYWQRWASDDEAGRGQQAMQDGDTKQAGPVKFSDLFQIVRPKIEFTFDAIADHTNQVFVVKTRPLVLNADFRRVKRISSTGSNSSSSGSNPQQRQNCPTAGNRTSGAPMKRPMCPMDRIAYSRRRSSLGDSEKLAPASGEACSGRDEGGAMGHNNPQTGNQSLPSVLSKHHEPVGKPTGSGANSNNNGNVSHSNTSAGSPKEQSCGQNSMQQLEDLDDQVSLRLKGQMIVLLGGQLCLYLCSPRVDHLDQLMECGVKMSDFALHDRARELMLMSHTHKEDREAVKKLDQASNDLKKMDTKLRQENKRTNEVLHNIFPAKIAALLSHGIKVESESFDLVTCLYSDIIGFTKMCGSENVRPIDIVETIGDAYVVVGGLPEPVEDHADRCVKMGLDMVKVISTVRSPADNQPIQMRIGIHSGPVMAGIVGIRVPRYSLFGNTTTLANKLESNGVGGKIHISDFTLKNLIKRDRFVVEDNPNESGGFPFVTYFVTNYLGDQNETLKHEKILEEQLIKDFELMGNEVELVDDSFHRQQLAYSYGQDEQIGPTSRKNPGLRPASSVLGISADDDPFIGGLVPEVGGSSKCQATTRQNDKETGAQQEFHTSRLAGERRRPPASLGESLANYSDNQQQQRERLILMDIEDQYQGGQLGQLSNQLSSSIISEAIRQVSSGVSVGGGSSAGRCAQLMVLILNASRELEVIVRHRAQVNKNRADNNNNRPGEGIELPQQASAGSSRAPGKQDPCPVCEGRGSLEASLDLVRLRLSEHDGKSLESTPVRALCAWLSNKLDSTSQLGEQQQQHESNGHHQILSRWDQRSQSTTSAATCESSLAGEVRAERHKVEHLLVNRRATTGLPASGDGIAGTRSQHDDGRLSKVHTAGVPAAVVGQTRSLSSEIQRIKRMDTLKCRRLKKKRQQQQQQQQYHKVIGGPEQAEDLELELELETELGQQKLRLAPEAGGPIDEEPEDAAANVSPTSESIVVEDSGSLCHSTGLRNSPGRKLDCGQIHQQQQQRDENPLEVPLSTNNQSNYQSIRSSLASLVNGVSQRAQNRKHRFSLNPFANLTFVSPFSSPVKQRQQPAPVRPLATSVQGIKVSKQAGKASPEAQGDAESRKQSSRSQSSGSTNNQQTTRHTRNSSGNCSCLKSSASSQSIDSSSR